MGVKTVSRMSNFHVATLATLLISILIGIQPAITEGISLELIPIYGYGSRFSLDNLTFLERHERIVNISKARAFYFMTSLANNSSNKYVFAVNATKINTLLPPITLHGALYITRMLIGTPRWTANLMFDTGCDDTWVQSVGCHPCFPLRGGNFKDLLRALHCEHPLCIPKMCDQAGMCRYHLEYLGGSSTSGLIGFDFFHFPSGGQSFQTVPHPMAFGLGLQNINMNFGQLHLGQNNIIGGIFSLGPGPRSILTQLGSLANRRFSYCLPSPTAQHQTYLHFGSDAHIRGPTVTPLIVSQHYFINIEGIGLEGRRLPIDPRVFQRVPGRHEGSLIDSGTATSMFVPSAYNVLRTNVVEHFEHRHGLKPLHHHGALPYDLCFNLRGRNLSSPSMTIFFQGAALNLAPSALFTQFSRSHCMTILPAQEEGPNILGAFQQVNHRFLYDVGEGTLAFAPENCQN
ncbi:hypothetical protein Ancab_029282 [Ancistrocladus abbreviatus]